MAIPKLRRCDGCNSAHRQLDADNAGPKLKNNSGAVDVRNSADDVYANLRAATITGSSIVGPVSGTTGAFSGAVSGTTGTFSGAVSGTTGTFSGAVSCAEPDADTKAPRLLDVKRLCPLIEFAFDGAAAPAAGTNTGKYGFCHTTGGSYVAGTIYYDDGATLTAITHSKGMRLVTAVAAAGTVTLINDAVYVAETGTAPFTWTLKLGPYTGGQTAVADLAAWVDVTTGADSVDRSDLNTKMSAIHTKLNALLDALQANGIISAS